MVIGLILDKILDEIVIASDAMTMIAEIIADSLIVIGPPVGPFIFETRSKAKATNTIPIPKDITDIKSTLPTILKAIPIAKTAIAINNIEASPFLIFDSFLGSEEPSIASGCFSSFF